MEDGTRSQVMREDRKAFANRLKKYDVPENHAVIVLMQQPNEDEDWTFSTAPIFEISSFINLFGEKQTEIGEHE